MSKSSFLPDQLHEYLRSVSDREPPLLRKLREETARLPDAGMQISPEQGQFMGLLAHLMGARRALEIGVFTGYSSLAVALALPDDGRIVACDVSEEYTAIARRYWKEAGVDRKIDLRLRPALETLRELMEQGQSGLFDLAFIDADKTNYRNYYESVLQLLRPGGLILIDNVLWDGDVIDAQKTDADTAAIRDFNQRLLSDERVFISMISLGDGVTLALKR